MLLIVLIQYVSICIFILVFWIFFMYTIYIHCLFLEIVTKLSIVKGFPTNLNYFVKHQEDNGLANNFSSILVVGQKKLSAIVNNHQ